MDLIGHKRTKPCWRLENAGRQQGTEMPWGWRRQERSRTALKGGRVCKGQLGAKAWSLAEHGGEGATCRMLAGSEANRRAVWALAATSDLLNREPEGDSRDGGGKSARNAE